MQWVRWYHGTIADPKWRAIARRTGFPVATIVAVWAAMIENASESEERGELRGFDSEDVAAALDLEPEAVEAILQAMQGKVLDGDKLSGWEKRNPAREDDSKERVRRYRERKKEAKRGVTHGNADVTQGIAPYTELEEDTEVTDSVAKATEREPLEEDSLPELTEADRESAAGLDLERDGVDDTEPADFDAELRATIAPAIRKRFWLGGRPPEKPIGGAPITMARELTAARQLAAGEDGTGGYTLAELAGGIEHFRKANNVPPDRRLSLLMFHRRDTRQYLHLAVAAWRAEQFEEAADSFGTQLTFSGNG